MVTSVLLVLYVDWHDVCSLSSRCFFRFVSEVVAKDTESSAPVERARYAYRTTWNYPRWEGKLNYYFDLIRHYWRGFIQ